LPGCAAEEATPEAGGIRLKACTNCRGNLADFVTVCPYCSVPQPVPQMQMAQPGWQVSPQNSNKAIASLVCGVILCFGPFTAIPAIILGHLALADIKRTSDRLAGKGLAIAGLALGYIGIAISTMYIIFIVITVRNTMGHGIPTNETAAISDMRMYNQALKKYAEKCPQQGYPATLLPLGPGSGDCTHSNLIDSRMAVQVPVRQGYMYQYNIGVAGPEKVTAFALVARPVSPGMSGTRFFYLDESGIIRESATQNIGPNSKPLDREQGSDDERKNEASAISNMHTYRQALTKYAGKCPQQGYPATLSQLGPGPGDCRHSNLIDARLAVEDAMQQGYIYKYSTGVTGPEKVTVFALVARPASPGSSGARFFFLDESGIIRESLTQIVGPNSKPLDEEQDPDD
jgi:hypothetical protein